MRDTETRPVDPFELVAALCDAEDWEMAREIARTADQNTRA